MKLYERLRQMSDDTPACENAALQGAGVSSLLQPGDRVRIRGERKIMTVVRVMDETWIAVKGGPYVGHAITAGSLEKVGEKE